MERSSWFDQVPVIGALPPEQAARTLREVGEEETAARLEQSENLGMQTFGPGGRKIRWPFQDKPWQHTAHTFGYLAPNLAGEHQQAIHHVEGISADAGLRSSRIKLTLNRLRVAAYPGGGMHHVLLHCHVQHQLPGKEEAVHFNTTYRAREGEAAGVQGSPLFIGLSVGTEGITLKCRTINVRNDQDEALLGFLESETFKRGLHLLNTAQPALAPFSEMAYGLAKALAVRNRNVSVQDFELGLDFSAMPLRGRLAEGAYLAVQIPESFAAIWDWEEWIYLPSRGAIVRRDDYRELIPYNYLVFGVSRYDDHARS